MPPEILTRRQLNRALLERQGLLRRGHWAPVELAEQLVGIQAQEPENPYIGLWARIEDFRPDDLATLLTSRKAARAILMRGTIHLVSAHDCLRIQPQTMAVLAAGFGSQFRRQLELVDHDELVALVRQELARRPSTRAELAAALGERWPGIDHTALGLAATYWVPLVQVPPRGVWGQRGAARWALTEDWLGRSGGAIAVADLVRRYLAAFGPASNADMRTWSRLTGLRTAFEALSGELRRFRDESGRELIDVADGPLPDPETPAPVRLLPFYDNLSLAHDDRSRILETATWYGPYRRGGAFVGGVLVDGFYRAFWKLEREEVKAAIRVVEFEPRRGDPKGARDEIAVEAERLLAVLAPEARPEVRFR